MSFRLSVHQFFVGQKEITTNHFAPKIQLFTKANFSEKDVWEFRPHRTRGAPWALKDRLHRLWKIGHPRWWYWWRFGISREWTCTDVRKVPSDCDVDDDPIEPVKEKSCAIADLTPRSGSLTWEGRGLVLMSSPSLSILCLTSWSSSPLRLSRRRGSAATSTLSRTVARKASTSGFASILSTCLGSTKCCPVLELIGWFILPYILM